MTSLARFLTEDLDGSSYAETGYYDAVSQCQYVLPKGERVISKEHHGLVIGVAGVDGIEFVLMPGDRTVYAYYPLETRMEPLAPDFGRFIAGWKSGAISV